MVTRHSEIVLGETMQNAACNAVHSAEQRIARWLSAAHDLIWDQAKPDTEAPLPITQELLGELLGFQRTSVTMVAQQLQVAELIRYTRGRICVVDRAGMERRACGCDQAIAALERRLLN